MLLIKRIALYCLIFCLSGYFTISFPNISDTKSLKLCAESWPPYDYKLNGKIVGSDIELNQKIFNSLGIKTTIMIMPWEKCWGLVEKGKIDGALMVSRKKIREKSVYYPKIPTTKADFVWVTNEHYQAKYFDACPNMTKEHLKIGIFKGNSYNGKFLQCLAKPYNQSHIIVYPSVEASMRMLILNKVQLVLAIPEIVKYYNEHLKIGQAYFKHAPLFTKVYYTVFAKNSDFSDLKYQNIEIVKDAYEKTLAQHFKNPA